MSLLADRLRRIDTALNCHRFCRYLEDSACHPGVSEWHESEIQRLKDLRVRVEQGHGRMTAFIPERKGEAT